ncbi:MAG: MaoC family dehydratase N-terminal domain-containing protein [Chloroflexi bacterium]|nr:MaoC family dehydratase N-terminal domain-containing protein [Chloroflexota bacterium]
MAKESLITPEMQKAVGTWHTPDFSPETVDRFKILRYAAATGDPNPLYRDDAYAGKTRWGGIIAPPNFCEVFDPGNRSFRENTGYAIFGRAFKAPFERVFMGSDEYEYHVPIRPGDAISCRGTQGDIYQKESSTGGGRLLFTELDKEYRNQRNEVVARATQTQIFAEFAPQASLVPRPSTEGNEVKPAAMNPGQVYFEDVSAGVALPSMQKRVTVTTICQWAGATGDIGLPHFDWEYMRQVYGIPFVIAHGPLSGTFLAQLATNWIGAEGVIKKHYTQYRGNTVPNDVITFSGKVSRKWTDGNENLVECETRAENQAGTLITLGKTVVTLPSRSQGAKNSSWQTN